MLCFQLHQNRTINESLETAESVSKDDPAWPGLVKHCSASQCHAFTSLGMVTYCGKFIENLTTLTHPLL